MQIHHLTPKTARKSRKRIARGGKRGKTSGRGGKGQTARAGNSTRPELRDFIKKLPKLRGHGKNRARTVNAERVRAAVVNLSALERVFSTGDTVTPESLVAHGLVRKVGRRAPKVKILGEGALSKKLSVSACAVSASARGAIEKAGGTVA